MNKETLSQKRVIINNPYGFDPLNSEIHRIVKMLEQSELQEVWVIKILINTGS